MSLFELALIGARDLVEGETEGIGRDGQAPERVTQLLGEPIATALALLENTLPHETEHFTRLLGQPGGGVEQALVGCERRIGSTQRGALVVVECHGQRARRSVAVQTGYR